MSVGRNWRDAFAGGTEHGFGVSFADEVVLEASVLAKPLVGRAVVQTVMAEASRIYDSLAFTHEADGAERTYLEWAATMPQSERLFGVTVLTKGDDGAIVHIAIHHRPLGPALRFSRELGVRLAGVVDPSHFHMEG